MRADRSGSNKLQWVGRILSGLVILFFVMDGGMRLFKPSFVVQATTKLAYPESTIVGIGVALLICTVPYLAPRTSVLGAILLTGYLGGAVASNVRIGAGCLNVLFPMIFAVLAWVGLWLRDDRLRELVPPVCETSQPTGIYESVSGSSTTDT